MEWLKSNRLLLSVTWSCKGSRWCYGGYTVWSDWREIGCFYLWPGAVREAGGAVEAIQYGVAERESGCFYLWPGAVREAGGAVEAIQYGVAERESGCFYLWPGAVREAGGAVEAIQYGVAERESGCFYLWSRAMRDFVVAIAGGESTLIRLQCRDLLHTLCSVAALLIKYSHLLLLITIGNWGSTN